MLNEQFEMVRKVVLTTSHLRFAQVMGMMDELAMSAAAEWSIWSHSDVFVVTPDESDEWEMGVWEMMNERTKDVLERLRREEKVATNMEGGGDAKERTKEENVAERKIGVPFWRYDWLSVVTVEAAMKAPWDPANDAVRKRLRLHITIPIQHTSGEKATGKGRRAMWTRSSLKATRLATRDTALRRQMGRGNDGDCVLDGRQPESDVPGKVVDSKR